MLSDSVNYKEDKAKIAQLWVHECRRVFGDRLVFKEDIAKFQEYLQKAFQMLHEGEITLDDEQKNLIMGDSNIFTTFI